MGATFGAPVDLDVESATHELHHPVGAFSPSGDLAVAWWTQNSDVGTIQLAKSKDGGATFAPAISVPVYTVPASTGLGSLPQYPAIAWDGGTLWMAYLVSDGNGPKRLVVDKSCDGGTTWSGAQLLNGPEPTITDDYQWPGLAATSGGPILFARKGSTGSDDLPCQVIRLLP
jgi:hypothetical protein